MTKHGLSGRPSNRKGKGLRAPSSTRSIRLPVSLWELLDEVAESQGSTVNGYVLEILSAAVAADRS